MRDHGGDIDRARTRFGAGDWIDLSTGINRTPWPAGPLSGHALHALPTASDLTRLRQAAAGWFGCDPALVLPVAGASAAIQLLPHALPRGRAAVLSPTYNEHAASLRAAGWQVDEPRTIDALHGAGLAVIVNPNNPDGRNWTPDEIRALASRVGHLIVDESFADPRPDLSVAGVLPENATVLRSFGKFWGLAGLRLGFAITQPPVARQLAERAGPWPLSGPAIQIGTAALADTAWARATITWLAEAALHLDQTLGKAGARLVGGTHLFRLYDLPGAAQMQERLARSHIWSRTFPYNPRWLRLGLPARDEFARLHAALGQRTMLT